MNMELVIVTLLVSSALLLAAVVLVQGRALRCARRDTEALRSELANLQQDLTALCTGASGVGSHLSRVDRHLVRLFERQDHLEAREQTHREYDHAVRMIQRGVGLDALIEQCHLPRAEAELLMRLHGSEKMRSVA